MKNDLTSNQFAEWVKIHITGLLISRVQSIYKPLRKNIYSFLGDIKSFAFCVSEKNKIVA